MYIPGLYECQLYIHRHPTSMTTSTTYHIILLMLCIPFFFHLFRPFSFPFYSVSSFVLDGLFRTLVYYRLVSCENVRNKICFNAANLGSVKLSPTLNILIFDKQVTIIVDVFALKFTFV